MSSVDSKEGTRSVSPGSCVVTGDFVAASFNAAGGTPRAEMSSRSTVAARRPNAARHSAAPVPELARISSTTEGGTTKTVTALTARTSKRAAL
jgi:hypothetical protein